MRIKGRTTAVLGTIFLVLMALVLVPTSLASCSTGVEENEDVVVEPTATFTSTPTSTPTQIPEPTQTPTPTATPTPVVPQPNIVYQFDGQTTEEDKVIIQRGIEMANRFFFLQLGRVVDHQVVINIVNLQGNPCFGGPLARVSLNTICINIGNEYWFSTALGASEQGKLKLVAHEYYHLLQVSLGCSTLLSPNSLAKEPAWLQEGTAEFMAHAAIDFAGVEKLDYRVSRWQDNDKRSSYLPALSTWETIEPGEQMPYVVPALAVHYLASTAGLGSVVAFCELNGKGLVWQDAFYQAFSITPTAFYEQFELYRANGYK